jgi:regulator of cell morphogenesis and NO signaling
MLKGLNMETNLTVNDPIKSFVEKNSQCIEVLEELNIDFCCGGDVSLLSASEARGLEPRRVYQRLMELPLVSLNKKRDFSAFTPTELIDHIESTHHKYLKKALPRLTGLMDKVNQSHSARHPKLVRLQKALENLREDLEPHLLKEEQVLFPLIRKLESNSSDLKIKALGGPILVMRCEHDEAGELLKEMRALANDYVPPADGCQSFQLLYMELRQLEEDTHLHIHKENNILFPALNETFHIIGKT